jgi:hypothetical protein
MELPGLELWSIWEGICLQDKSAAYNQLNPCYWSPDSLIASRTWNITMRMERDLVHSTCFKHRLKWWLRIPAANGASLLRCRAQCWMHSSAPVTSIPQLPGTAMFLCLNAERYKVQNRVPTLFSKYVLIQSKQCCIYIWKKYVPSS